MKRKHPLLLFTILAILLQACNTLYNTKSIDIEVLEPGKVELPANYKKLAIRNNNVNIAFNPAFAAYNIDSTICMDSVNLDSIASWIYYDYLLHSLRQQEYLDTVWEIAPEDYSNTNISDFLPSPEVALSDSSFYSDNETGLVISYILSTFLKINPLPLKESGTVKKIDPDRGLYTEADISAIADSTRADLFLSLDHFATLNSVLHNTNGSIVQEFVIINTFWTLYDLHNLKLQSYFQKKDTIDWMNYSSPDINPFKLVPPRKDAVLNASDMAGTNFAEFMVPHWLRVERFYYRSGHVELKKTNELVKAGQWIEAAEIWRNNLDNPSKSIQAKCMFNLGLACEMNGDMDAALDWIVRSYHILGEKNDIHAGNCKAYIKILAKRKLDFNILDGRSPETDTWNN